MQPNQADLSLICILSGKLQFCANTSGCCNNLFSQGLYSKLAANASKMKKIALYTLFALCFQSLKAQLVVNNTTMTPAQLVQNVLLGTGITATNITFNGTAATSVNEQAGSFNGTASNIGISQGVILGSGDVTVAVGPNNSGSASLGGPGTPGTDPDLAAITPNQIYDEAILEFDFIPLGDSVSFRYVFASEEYDEYVCGSVNDAFGFFISGPGISGPYSNNGINIALIPGTTTPVSINTVNLGVPGSTTGGSAANCTAIDPNWASYNIYYAGTNTQNTVQYDGFTVVLTAKTAVQCGETYHIKLAIGDAGDNVFDSGVFLEGGSFNSNGIGISISTPFPNNTILEGCGDALINVFHSNTSITDTIIIDYGGNAVMGTDYSNALDTIFLTTGMTDTTFNISALVDNLPEGTDTITLTLVGISGCNYEYILINDYEAMTLLVPDSINICTPVESGLLTGILTGGIGPYSYVWDNGAAAGDSVYVSPEATTFYTLTVTDGCGNNISAGPEKVYVQCPVIPTNVFSPNGDGKNDQFEIINLEEYPNASIKIYNRWGELVYQSDNYQNDWNGKHYKNHKDVPEGVYFWIVSPNSTKYPYQNDGKDKQKYTLNGNVTIVR